MPKRADQVISIRVPNGLPNEIRALSGMPFSEFTRKMLVAARDNLQQAKAKSDAEEATDE